MRLSTLELQQFRSYGSLSLDMSGGDVHVLIGENGAGKTNILEAVSILSLTRSCLGTDEADLPQWGTDFYRVRGTGTNDAGEERQLEVVSQRAPRVQKACFLNDVRSPVEDIIGILPTVVFLPQDLQLFTGPPSARRKFLDRLLCQVSPEYLRSLAQYQKVLKQRNSLLKRIAEGKAPEAELDLWDEHLIAHAAPVTAARLKLIGTLQLTLPEEIRSLGEQWADVRLVYESKGDGETDEELQVQYREALRHSRRRDCILQSTSVGPHREDWTICVDERPLGSFASRGQQRTSLLALLLLQVSYLELRCGEKPLILLDDVFSELDDNHQRNLLTSLTGYQVIITTTRIPDGCDGVQLMMVESGAVRQIDAEESKTLSVAV